MRSASRSSPSFCLLVAVCEPDPPLLERLLASVMSQAFPRWELRLAAIGPEAHRAIDEACRRALGRRGDPRVGTTECAREASEPAALSAALSAARSVTPQAAMSVTPQAVMSVTPQAVLQGANPGGLVGVVGQHDSLSPSALDTVAEALRQAPDPPGVVYSDEDEIDEAGSFLRPLLKPGWSPELLLASPYVGRLLLVRRDLLAQAGWMSSAAGAHWEHDLMLRTTAAATSVLHVPEVLYHRATAPAAFVAAATAGTSGSPGVAEVAEVAEEPGAGLHVARAAARATSGSPTSASVQPDGPLPLVERGPLPGTWRVRRPLGSAPLVSIIVPFRDGAPLLRKCVESIRATKGSVEVEMLLVDNDSHEPETSALIERLATWPEVRVLEHPGEFNWATVNNAAVASAKGDVLAFMNDDVEALHDGWLERLVEHAMRPDIGAVGARLLYPGGALQHAGLVLGMGGAAGHVLRGLSPGEPGYLGMAVLGRDCSAVTGACMVTRRAVFDELSGFDERLALDLNDIDFCLRLGQKGYRVIYAPEAELVHHEGPSRGISGSVPDILAFLARWEGTVRAGDRFFNPHLSRIDCGCSLAMPGEERWWNHWLSTLRS